MVTEADREAELSKIIAELRALLDTATPGDLNTAERHIENETVECPACQGDGEIEAADYCNFDGAALGVQFYGIGHEFGAHEKLWAATIKALPMLLDAADPARHRTASTAALTAEVAQVLADASRMLRDAGLGSQAGDLMAKANKLAALSTPSEVDSPNPDEVAGTYSAFEVSEPVADHIGGEGEKRVRDLLIGAGVHENEDTAIGLVPYPVAAQAVRDALRLATPPNTNGDAVREALEATQTLLEQIDHHGSTNFREVRERIVANRATLAKHGGATNV